VSTMLLTDVARIPGLDWVIHRHDRGWHAELIWRTTLMAVVYGASRPILLLRMRLAEPAAVAAVRLGPPSANARPEWRPSDR
jgi:hypothetical protein